MVALFAFLCHTPEISYLHCWYITSLHLPVLKRPFKSGIFLCIWYCLSFHWTCLAELVAILFFVFKKHFLYLWHDLIHIQSLFPDEFTVLAPGKLWHKHNPQMNTIQLSTTPKYHLENMGVFAILLSLAFWTTKRMSSFFRLHASVSFKNPFSYTQTIYFRHL